ncbi:hypothetical protein L5515_012406 [Caenorhabditis briggsae]|uniref:SCP domain-containing protein n=1 Tax=Caenorhabditis briggsae TaxID=6238 RepID=A0AAE9JHT4_CAEBR|nr:hypothetical protein L5515_012406 [Caenorhabditis briggsae]
MRKMKWDLSLAEKAQNVTDSCPDNINTGDGYGENVLASYVENPGKALEITLLDVEVWKMQFGMRLEDLLSLNGNIQNYELTKTTQMAWAEIDSIGCGFSNCGKKSSGSKTKVVVACMYKISSSRISQEKPYKISTNPSESSIQQLAVNATTYWKEQFRFQSFNADYFKNAITKDSQM